MQHLSLETCQKLKDAGFPQKDCVFSWWAVPDSTPTIVDLLNRKPLATVDEFRQLIVQPSPTYDDGITKVIHGLDIQWGKWLCVCPTLEELLHYLGDRFYLLRRGHCDGWVSFSGKSGGTMRRGRTAIDAVVKLCLNALETGEDNK